MNPILQQAMVNRNLSNVMQVLNAVKSGNVESLFNQLMNTNPDFKNFVQANQGKSTEQIINDNNINVSQLKDVPQLMNILHGAQ